ncbi:hypothetical protein Poli38472_010632 [Pythium oligandrum]|uniref:N-acetyltransferase domain-containing protein n=1 Tax=Pythium oligandrum TaxID=41045 RepID=A0A8K1C3G3_PYTOL|nr:hypothetical protein Poli38472_010632 [Pythium oligandrum]|eukprot:TMW55750.1 hypothetical protein Poli38472_010632 [Pythium oligandrum]
MPLRLQRLTLERHDIERVIALEAASYPADEAATPDMIRFRQQHAGAFFYAAYLAEDENALVGFVNGTLTKSQELEEETMSEHEPSGTTLCIHSVVVDAAHRRKGFAGAMLKEYVRIICEQELQVKRIALIAKAYLTGFYISCGFTATRLSPVVHGKDPWFELVLDCEAARRLTVVQVDAFSSEIFDGNPAAVVVMPPAQFHKPGVEKWMLSVAKENNLSETAYLARREGGSNGIAEYDLRWFTPGCEVTLCGHATLSSAYVLFEEGHLDPSTTIHFHTLSGVLVCSQQIENGKKWIQMDFPLRDLVPVSSDISLDELARGLNLVASDIIAAKQTQTSDVLVQISTEKFAAIEPNFDLLGKVEARGIVVTSLAPPNDKGVDFQSRFFGPRVGIPEDPVTGSAHCALAGYWSEQLQKTSLYAHQACPVRGGYISITIPEDKKDRVYLKGEAIISLRGTLFTSP